MSATIEVLTGACNVRLDGVSEVVNAPFTIEGVDYDPQVARPTLAEEIDKFKTAVIAAMETDLKCPAVGSASTPPVQGAAGVKVAGTFRITAVDEPVFLRLYAEKTSAHPDETFGQPAPQTEATLDPGESIELATVDSNAWTALILTA
jgi:hypothetical protein